MSSAAPTINDKDFKLLSEWRISTFWVMLLGYVGYYLCRANLSAAFPLMSRDLGFTNQQLGLIAFTSELAYALGKFINGPLGDKIGGKKIFLLGMLGAIVANFVMAINSTLIGFVIVWCVCRYFLSMGWGGLAKVIGNWYEPEKNGTVMGFISLNFQFGGVVATLFAGWIVAMGGRWQDVFIYPPLVLLAVFVWSYFASKDSPQDVIPGTTFGKSTAGRKSILSNSTSISEAKSTYWGTVLSLLRLPIFRHLLLFSFVTTFLRSIFFFWIPMILVDIGAEASTAIFRSALFPFLGCLGTILLGWYTDKYAKDGNRARMTWIMLTGLIACLFTIAAIMGRGTLNEQEQIMIMLLLGGSGFFLLGPYSMSSGALTLDIAGPEAAGSCTGILDGLGYIGGALAVWLAGHYSDILGWGQVFSFLGIMACVATLSAMGMSVSFKRSAKKKLLGQNT